MQRWWKVISVFITCAALAAACAVYLRPSQVSAEGEMIGYVDSEKIIDKYPVAQSVNKELEGLRTQHESDFQKKVQDKYGTGDVQSLPREAHLEIQKMMDDAEKEFNDESDALRAKKWVPIVDAVNDTISKVADQEKLHVVLDKAAVIYGGVDITDKVIAQLPRK
jgi:outer membrane protein